MKKSVTLDDVPPKVITYEEGQNAQYHVLPKDVSNVATVSTLDDTGGPQVIEPATEAEKAAALAAQDRSPMTNEVIEVEDDPLPQMQMLWTSLLVKPWTLLAEKQPKVLGKYLRLVKI